MQSLGDNTLAAFMKSDITSKDSEVGNSSTSNNVSIQRRKQCAGKSNDSDIAKYFNDSLIFLSRDVSREKEIRQPTSIHLDTICESPRTVEDAKSKESSRDKHLSSITSSKSSINGASHGAKPGRSFARRKNYSQLGTYINRSKKQNSVLAESQNTIQPPNNLSTELPTVPARNSSSEISELQREDSTNRSECKSTNCTTDSSIEVPSRISTPDRCKLASWGLPLTILRKYEARGVARMFPWQVECLSNRNLLEKNRNLVYSAPTSAGKTLVAEILVIKTVIERRKKVIFILPFVSVVREKMYYFQDLLSDSGVRVEGFMGGCAPAGGFAATDVAIATIEKANSLLNQLMEEGNLVSLGAVVIDELHLLGDPYRGYLLELLLTKLKYMTIREELVDVQLIGMSATLPNLALLANWLDAELYKTDFRPVPLNELCKIGPTIYDNKMNTQRTVSPVPELAGDCDNILQLCIETITDGHSVLIFCPTKNWCENLAQQIAQTFSKLGREDSPMGRVLREQLSTEAIVETLEQLKRCPIGLDAVLRTTVSFGTAFHHAGLTMDERDVVEGAFRSGALRVLTATSTLSSGVNLPARRVIIRSLMFHGKPLDTLTYRQMIGRAGRMGKDTAGESILMCKPNETKPASLLLCAQLQPIESCLEGSEPLIRALLEAVASEVAYTARDIELYVKCTLVSCTNHDLIRESTREAIEYLVDKELLMLQKTTTGDERWVATPLGKACLAASIPPTDGLFLFEELQRARRCFVLDTELHVIYLVTPLNSSSQIGQIDWLSFFDLWKSISESERRVGQLVGVEENFLMAGIRGVARAGKALDVHKRFYTALALHELVREVPLAHVCQKYRCNRGVLQALQQNAATFAGMITQFCKKLGWSCMELLIGQFQARLQFGVCRELLDLLRLPMLNGLRARSLYKEGITSVAELAVANELDVERALHKALPFESGKGIEGEHEVDAARRNKMRTVFVTGRDGLTPREAAVILVREARTLVQNELGVEEVQWNQREASRKSSTSSESSDEASGATLERGSSVDSLPKTRDESPKSLVVQEESAGRDDEIQQYGDTPERRELSMRVDTKMELSEVLEKVVEPACDNLEPARITPDNREDVSDTSKVIATEEIFEFTGRMEAELMTIEENAAKPLAQSPGLLLLRESVSKTSELGSPSLFGDSLNIDSQEYNMLEQNVIDSLNISAFGGSNFSCGAEEVKTSPEKLVSEPKKLPTDLNAERRTTPKNSSRGLTLEPKNRSQSILWDDDSWNMTNGIIETVNRMKKAASTTQKIDLPTKIPRRDPVLDKTDNNLFKTVGVIHKTSSRAEKDSTSIKMSPKDPILDKKDNIIFKTVDGVNKTTLRAKKDNTLAKIPGKDLILDKVDGKISITPMSKSEYPKIQTSKSRLAELRKIPQKRKLSEPESEKSPIASVVTFPAGRRLSVDSNKSDSDDVVVPSQNSATSSCTAKNRTRMKLESLRRSRTQRGTTPMACGVSKAEKKVDEEASDDSVDSFVSNSDVETSIKRPNALTKSSVAKVTEKGSLLRKRKEAKIPVDGSKVAKQPVLNKVDEPKVVNVTSNWAKFNIFKRALLGRMSIALALGCESFSRTTVTIGTRVIGVTGADGRRKAKKIENCVDGNKKLCGVAITWDNQVVHYISFDNSLDSKVPVKDRLDVLTEILTNKDLIVRCFSIKETYKILYNCCRITSSCKFLDPRIADWLLDPDQPERSFNALIKEHLAEGQHLLQRVGNHMGDTGPGSNVKSVVDSEARAATEAALTWQLTNLLMAKLGKRSPTLLTTFEDIEMGTATLLARMELTGIGVNLKSLQELSEVIQREMSELENRAYSHAGKKFNFSSSKSVAQVLGMYKGKKVSTNKAALEHCDNPISGMVTSWRKLSTTQTKIVFPLLRLAECSSRVYGNCLTTTTTGRISMHEPNLQNVPRDFTSEDGSFVISVRMAFTPMLGNVILSADYCQLELRILAHFSKEPNLCKILKKEGDVFRNIAARWNNVAEESVDDEMRQRTKQLCYGMIYGMGVKTLSETLAVTETEAKEFLETFMSAYPGIRKWLVQVVEDARAAGYVKTLMHRRRYFPALASESPGERGQAERQAVNTKVQGSAADIAKKAMIAIDERMRREFPGIPLVLADAPLKRKLRSRSRDPLPSGGYLILQIHDEFLYEVNAADLETVGRIIKESMEHSSALRVPLPVKLKIGPTWGDLAEYKCQS